jgi:hypothetical protein
MKMWTLSCATPVAYPANSVRVSMPSVKVPSSSQISFQHNESPFVPEVMNPKTYHSNLLSSLFSSIENAAK